MSGRFLPPYNIKIRKKEKRRNLYLLPSYCWRLLALPYSCRTATQKPTPVYAIYASGRILSQDNRPDAKYYITTGIYRCSFLDMNMKFCENFQQSRISADKRFLKYVNTHLIPLNPKPGFCGQVCNCKFTNYI